MAGCYTLYRFFDEDGSLLYVGLTINPGRRMQQHKNQKTWWSDVARIEMEQYADQESLREAERLAIETERPTYNVRMNGRAQFERQIEWNCDVCGNPVADNQGYITVNFQEIKRWPESVAEWKERNGFRPGWHAIALSQTTDYPNKPAWKILHERCDPDIESTDYWIGVERIRTVEEVMSWTHHLLGKGWIQNTAWRHVIRRAMEI